MALIAVSAAPAPRTDPRYSPESIEPLAKVFAMLIALAWISSGVKVAAASPVAASASPVAALRAAPAASLRAAAPFKASASFSSGYAGYAGISPALPIPCLANWVVAASPVAASASPVAALRAAPAASLRAAAPSKASAAAPRAREPPTIEPTPPVTIEGKK